MFQFHYRKMHMSSSSSFQLHRLFLHGNILLFVLLVLFVQIKIDDVFIYFIDKGITYSKDVVYRW